MNIGVVVSRFNEVPDVYCKIFDLIKNFEDFFGEKGFFSGASLYFYNKGSALSLTEMERLQSYGFKNIDYIELPNVGREAHTWIYHMRTMVQKGKLEDLIYFIPGSFSRKLKPKTVRSESVIDSSDLTRFNQKGLNQRFKTPEGFRPFESGTEGLYSEAAVVQVMVRNIILVNNPCPFGVEAGFVLDDWKGTDPDNLKDTVKQKYSLAKIRPFGAWFQNLTTSESFRPSGLYLHGWGNGLMGFLQTSRDRILKYSYEFYEECEKELEENGENGELPHYWERSWATLFGIKRSF